jgi:type VI secretion system protein ImpG
VKLKQFYDAELSALRSEAADFALKYRDTAHALGLGAHKGPSADPQVELLVQSFAFLTGRLRYQMAQDEAALPNALLGLLYPHLEAPVPSMLVAQIAVKPDGANFAVEQVLPRGRYVKAGATDERGRKVDCRFRTCYDTPLLPLQVEDIATLPASSYAFLRTSPKVQSVLRVRLRADATLNGGGPKRIRFYISNAEQHANALYEALALNLAGIAVCEPEPGNPTSFDGAPLHAGLGPAALRWLGMHEHEAVLEQPTASHPGYRLLQEYFAFPEKFMFFDVEGLCFKCASQEFDLLFLLDAPMDKEIQFTQQALRLNCVPLVNLFAQRIDPLALDHTQYEYRLEGDIENHRCCEIHTLQQLESIRPDGSVRRIAPYFAADQLEQLEHQDYFYIARREPSQRAGVAGTELYVSFLDERFDLAQLPDEVVGGKALCTNRRLPERLMAGHPLQLEGPGPVREMHVLTKPTPHQTPAQVGTRPWQLVSQLALNHLSLSDRPQALAALKEILLLHAGPDKKRALRQVDGIQSMACRPLVRQIGEDGWRGFTRGIEVTLEMDRNHFNDASPVLFCSVLRRFMAQYTTVNSFVQVRLQTHDINEGKQQWLPQSGDRPIL